MGKLGGMGTAVGSPGLLLRVLFTTRTVTTDALVSPMEFLDVFCELTACEIIEYVGTDRLRRQRRHRL